MFWDFLFTYLEMSPFPVSFSLTCIWHFRWRATKLTWTRHSGPLSSGGFLTCHSHCDKGQSFIMVVSVNQTLTPYAERLSVGSHSVLNLSSVTHGWFSSILSFITRGSTMWRSLVFNQIFMTSATFSIPMKLRVMYAFCSSVLEARFSNQHGGIDMCCYGMLWISVYFYNYNILDGWDSTSKCIYCSI